MVSGAERAAPAWPKKMRLVDRAFVLMVPTSSLESVVLGDVEPAGMARVRAHGVQPQTVFPAVIADTAVVHRAQIDENRPECAVTGFLEPVGEIELVANLHVGR